MSTLSEALRQYVAVRRALGAKLWEPAKTLEQFVDFLKSQRAKFITSELALRWAMLPKNVQHATWARRLSMVRRFAMWLSATDPRTQVPLPRLISGRRRRNPPHIFTDHEVKQLMIEASRLSSAKGLRARTYATIIGLLASTGLRPGEVLTLARPDVDLQSGILFIRETKFGKSRFVPLHDSTCSALSDYARRRDKLGIRLQSEAFFVTEIGRPLTACTVRRTFARISRAIGLRAAKVLAGVYCQAPAHKCKWFSVKGLPARVCITHAGYYGVRPTRVNPRDFVAAGFVWKAQWRCVADPSLPARGTAVRIAGFG